MSAGFPVPHEIEKEILLKSDSVGIFSYITSNSEIYQRALNPKFWLDFEYYTFEGIFLEASKHKTYDILKSIVSSGRRIDSYYYAQVWARFLANDDIAGISVVGSIEQRSDVLTLYNAFKNKNLTMVEQLLYYIDTVTPNLKYSDVEWIFEYDFIFPNELQEEIAASFIRVRNYNAFTSIYHNAVKKIRRVNFERTRGREIYVDRIPYFNVIAGFADYDYYNKLLITREYVEDKYINGIEYESSCDEEWCLIDFIVDRQIFYRLLEIRRNNNYPVRIGHPTTRSSVENILLAGIALNPYEWLNLLEEENEHLISRAADKASYWFENFYWVIQEEFSLIQVKM
jgi:hypothetical protein